MGMGGMGGKKLHVIVMITQSAQSRRTPEENSSPPPYTLPTKGTFVGINTASISILILIITFTNLSRNGLLSLPHDLLNIVGNVSSC